MNIPDKFDTQMFLSTTVYFCFLMAQCSKTLKLKTVEAGASTSVYAATAPELEGSGGVYLENCGVAAINDDETIDGGVRSYAVDPDAAAKLWAVSEELVGATKYL